MKKFHNIGARSNIEERHLSQFTICVQLLRRIAGLIKCDVH